MEENVIKTAEELKVSVSDTTVIKEGEILNGNQSVEGLKAWIEELAL